MVVLTGRGKVFIPAPDWRDVTRDPAGGRESGFDHLPSNAGALERESELGGESFLWLKTYLYVHRG